MYTSELARHQNRVIFLGITLIFAVYSERAIHQSTTMQSRATTPGRPSPSAATSLSPTASKTSPKKSPIRSTRTTCSREINTNIVQGPMTPVANTNCGYQEASLIAKNKNAPSITIRVIEKMVILIL